MLLGRVIISLFSTFYFLPKKDKVKKIASKIKITVIKTIEPSIIFEGNVSIAPSGKQYEKCLRYTKGDTYVVNDRTEIPEGFSSWAWRDIYKDTSVLAFGNFKNWMEDGKMISCCTDGIRPVIFELRRIKE